MIMGLSAIVMIPRMNISVARIAKVLETENSIPDTGSRIDKKQVSAELEFRNVSFHYDQADE